MGKAVEITYKEISKTFMYTDENLFRIDKRTGMWRMVDISKITRGNRYVRVDFMGRMVNAHRIIYSLANQTDVDTLLYIDHLNGDRLDNRPDNLRLVTSRENGQNLPIHRKGRKCGFTWNKKRGAWQAQITINGRNKFIGFFASEDLAHIAYLEACNQLKGQGGK